MSDKKVMVSACLLGEQCRFDGGTCTNQELKEDLEGVELISVCPEEMGGLATPRPRARIVGKDGSADGVDVLNGEADVLTHEGNDVSDAYIRGGMKTLDLAKSSGAGLAILKSNSPSCGCGKVFTEDFQNLREGDGTTTAILKNAGIHVVNDVDYHEALDQYKEK
ncbi:DUF523 domain-containing protein [Endozoicomonas elysicola]|uniref:Uncharacterized protein n=1 Tax=Endozoicomonas elysicola TaxID=305900 RepID=A0A081K7N7_9GAMM|nr:DUF523 domain-containing protein [Endozoicomonas elysicola]KEI70163.1 hypothetical protein GV64_04860 [Endozoicomonas elysicola]